MRTSRNTNFSCIPNLTLKRPDLTLDLFSSSSSNRSSLASNPLMWILASMSSSIFWCSEVFNELKALFLFCLLLSRLRSSTSKRAIFRSRCGAAAGAGVWGGKGEGRGAGAAGGTGRGSAGIGAWRGGGREKQEFFCLSAFVLLDFAGVEDRQLDPREAEILWLLQSSNYLTYGLSILVLLPFPAKEE